MGKPPTVRLADGEPELEELPDKKRTVRQVARDAVLNGMAVAGSVGPLRRAAKRMYFGALGAVWRRKKRREKRRK